MALAQQLHLAEAFFFLGQTTESSRTGSGSHQLDDGVLFVLRQPECGCQHDTSPGAKKSINSFFSYTGTSKIELPFLCRPPLVLP
jgi:hypothetical protein